MARPRRTSVTNTDKSETTVVVKVKDVVDDDKSDIPISEEKLPVEQKQPQSNLTTKKSENVSSNYSGNITEMSFQIDAKKSRNEKVDSTHVIFLFHSHYA